MDFMSILGRCLLLPFPVAMFVGCLFPGIDDRFTGGQFGYRKLLYVKVVF